MQVSCSLKRFSQFLLNHLYLELMLAGRQTSESSHIIIGFRVNSQEVCHSRTCKRATSRSLNIIASFGVLSTKVTLESIVLWLVESGQRYRLLASNFHRATSYMMSLSELRYPRSLPSYHIITAPRNDL